VDALRVDRPGESGLDREGGKEGRELTWTAGVQDDATVELGMRRLQPD